MKKEFYSFKAIEKAFLKSNKNGKITKINGGVNVVFDINKDQWGYNYRGTNSEIVKKLNLTITEDKEITIKKELKEERKEIILNIELDLLNLFIKDKTHKNFKCFITGDSIIIENRSERKLYKSKKGIYFILKGKRQYIEDLEVKKEIEPAAEETEQEQQIRENNNYITLTEEQKKERIELINLWNTKAPGDKEQGKERFLQLLFEYQEQKKTKEEFKRHINKLYAANKNIKSCYTGKKDFNNYLTDLLATEDILQKNDIIKNEFFNNAYNYIKSC